MSEALAVLYGGEPERARELLPPDEDLSVFEAAAFGRVERLRAILEEHAEAARAFSADGFTALHLAVFGVQEDAARVLIEHGAALDAVSTASLAQVTPLGTAAFVRSVPMARLLLEAGADPNANDGAARATAVENGDEELIRLLGAGTE